MIHLLPKGIVSRFFLLSKTWPKKLSIVSFLLPYIALFVFPTAFAACTKEPPPPVELNCTQVPLGPGPEDMELDLSGRPRLIFSSHDRRDFDKEGDLYSLDLKTGGKSVITRRDEPENFAFRPHGISLVKSVSGESVLYVVIHETRITGKGHGIAVYKLTGNLAIFRDYLQDPLLDSPNDLVALPDGTMYVANDAHGKTGLLNLIIPAKNSTVLYYNGNEWSIAVKGLRFSAGMVRSGQNLLVSDAKAQRILSYRIENDASLTPVSEIMSTYENPDNLLITPEQELLVAEHYDTFSFVHHARNTLHPAPSTVEKFQLDKNGLPVAENSQILYSNPGGEFSAASSAMIYRNRLYLGQAFDWGILVCDLDTPETPGGQR